MQKQIKWRFINPEFYTLKIQHQDGIKSSTTLEEGVFKIPIDHCINKQLGTVSNHFETVCTRNKEDLKCHLIIRNKIITLYFIFPLSHFRCRIWWVKRPEWLWAIQVTIAIISLLQAFLLIYLQYKVCRFHYLIVSNRYLYFIPLWEWMWCHNRGVYRAEGHSLKMSFFVKFHENSTMLNIGVFNLPYYFVW